MKKVLKIALGVIVVLCVIGYFADDEDSGTDTQPVAELEETDSDGSADEGDGGTSDDTDGTTSDEADGGGEGSEEEPEMSQEEFMEACEHYKYRDLLRYPEESVGKMIKFKANVAQIMEEGEQTAYRCYTELLTSTQSLMLDNELIIVDSREADTTRIIQDDTLIVYAVCGGTEEFVRGVSGATQEVPVVSMKYCDILPEGDDIMSDAVNSVY